MPLVETLFAQNTQGWTAVSGQEASHTPVWVAPAGGVSGACRYSPQSADGSWKFVAPAGFSGNHSQLYGGTIIFEFDMAQATPPASYPSSAEGVVLAAANSRISIDPSAANAVSSAGSPGSYLVTLPVKAGADWKNSSGGAATETEIRAVLNALTGFSISGAQATTAAWTQLGAIAFVADPSVALSALRDRLVAHRTTVAGSSPTNYKYAFDATTFPAGLAESADLVRSGLQAAVGASITLQTEATPTLNTAGTSLTLAGSMDPLNLGDTPWTFTATTDRRGILQATLEAALPDHWFWGDSVAALASSPADAISFRNARFTVSSTGTSTFEGTTDIPSDLEIFKSPPTSPVTVTLRGTVTDVGGNSPHLSLTASGSIGPITIQRVDQTALSFSATAINLTESRFNASGTVAIGNAAALSANLDLPHKASGPLTLQTVQANFGSLPKVSDVLALLNTPAGVTNVLASLPSIANPSGIDVSIEFDPQGIEPTHTSLALNSNNSWTLVPAGSSQAALAIGAPTLKLVVSREKVPDGTIRTSFDAEAVGTLVLGSATYHVKLGFYLNDYAFLVIGGQAGVPQTQALSAAIGFGNSAISAALPSPLLTLGSIQLSEVGLEIDLQSRSVASVHVVVGQTQPWTIAGVATLDQWKAFVRLQRSANGWAASGAVEGSIALGSGANRVQLAARISLPRTSDLWTLALAEGSSVYIPTVGELLALIGSGATLPAGLSSLGGLTITRFQIAFDAQASSIAYLAFASEQSSTWIIIPGVSISNLQTSLSFLPTPSPIRASGMLHGVVNIAAQSVDVSLIKNDFDGDWLLQAAYAAPAHVPGFSSLDAWFSPDASRQYLPSNLPLAHGFDVSNVQLKFAGANGNLSEIGFQILATDVWPLIAGKLEITTVFAQISVPHPTDTTRLTGTIGGSVVVGGALIALSGTKPAENLPWELAGSLTESFDIDLLDAANAISTSTFALPRDLASFGAFPAKVTLQTADVRAIPATGLFHFDGLVTFTWTPSLGGLQLSFEQLGGTIDVAKTGDPVVVRIAGTLAIAGLRAAVGLQVGSASTETILAGSITAANASSVNFPQLADGIGATGTSEKWNSLIPAGMAPMQISSAGIVYANFTRNEFLLYGTLQNFGAALLFCRKSGARWNYAFAASLTTGTESAFRFAQLQPSLSVIDDTVTVHAARLIISNLPETPLSQFATDANSALQAAAPGTPSPLGVLDATSGSLRLGALFVAEIDFTAPSILKRILDVGDGAVPARAYLSGILDHSNPVNTKFAADLPDITLFDTIRLTHNSAYHGVHLEYVPAQAHEFKVFGRIVIELFGSSYGFDITASVNDDRFVVSAVTPTSQSLTPFSLPGIRISSLALAAEIDFAKPAVPSRDGQPGRAAQSKSTRFTLQGTVIMGAAPQQGQPDHRLYLSTKLFLSDKQPALLLVTIDRDLSIVQFLSQCLTGSGAEWSSSIDLVIQPPSAIFYYRAANDPDHALATLDGRTFTDGYHIDALLRITLLFDIQVHGRIDILQDANGNTLGVQASIALTSPLELVFAQLCSSTRSPADGPYQGGPSVVFKTGAGAYFGADAGINFLGDPFGTFRVLIHADSAGARHFAGHLSAANEIAPFGALALDFEYIVPSQGPASFHLANWPDFTWERELVNLAKAIKDAYNASQIGGCDALGDLIAERTFTTNWSFSPHVNFDGDNLIFSLSGSYLCTLTGTTSPFVTVEFAPFDLRIPKTTRFSDLPEAIASGVAAESIAIIGKLLSQPEKIALFLAIVFGPRAAGYAAQLLCKGLTDSGVPGAADAASTAFDSAAGAGGGGAAGLSAGLAAAAGAVSSIFGGGGGSGTGSGTAPDTSPQAPPSLTCTYANGTFTLRWGAARYVNGYQVELRGPAAQSPAVFAASLGSNVYSLSRAVVSSSLAAGTYTAAVRGIRGSLQSAWTTAPISKPQPPATTLTFQVSSVGLPELTASCPAVQGATYGFEMFAPDGRFITSSSDLTAPTMTFQVPDWLFVAGSFKAHARLSSPTTIPSDFGSPGTATVVTLPAPEYLIASVEPASPSTSGQRRVATRWKAVPGATGYAVDVMDGMNHADGGGSYFRSPEPHAISIPRPGSLFGDGKNYQVRVRAVQPAIGELTSVTLPFGDSPQWTVSVRNDLAATESDNGILRVQVTQPASSGASEINIARGATASLSPNPIIAFRILRPAGTDGGLSFMTQYAVRATRRGATQTLAFTAIRDAHTAPDFNVAASPGIVLGQREVYTDVVSAPEMALLVSDASQNISQISSTLRKLYPALSQSGLGPALFNAARAWTDVFPVLRAALPLAATVAAELSSGFQYIAQPLDVAELAVIMRPMLTTAPSTALSVAQILFPFSFPASPTETRITATAFAMAILGYTQSHIASAFAQISQTSGMSAAAISAAVQPAFQGDSVSRAKEYGTLLLRELTIAPPVIAQRLLRQFHVPSASLPSVLDAVFTIASSAKTLFQLCWAYMTAGVTFSQMLSHIQPLLPGTTPTDIANTTEIFQRSQTVALRTTLGAETISRTGAVRRHREAFVGVLPLDAGYAICASDDIGVARPSVIAAAMGIGGITNDHWSSVLAQLFPGLSASAISLVATDAAHIQLLYQ